MTVSLILLMAATLSLILAIRRFLPAVSVLRGCGRFMLVYDLFQVVALDWMSRAQHLGPPLGVRPLTAPFYCTLLTY